MGKGGEETPALKGETPALKGEERTFIIFYRII